jgi:type III secretory pathway component EscU
MSFGTARVPVLADAALAQALREVEPGDEIPESAFEAAAQLLAATDSQ